MNDKITAQIITSYREGSVYEYSVKDYVDYVNDNLTKFDDKTIALVNAMACNGKYAKAYFNNESLEPTPEMDSVTANDLKAYEKEEQGSLPEGIAYYGSSLILESNTTLRHYFTVADGTDIGSYNFSGSKGNHYYIDISDIPAGELMKTYSTSIGGYTIKYSPMTYVYTVLNSDSASDSLKNTVKALYLYGQAALAYAN